MLVVPYAKEEKKVFRRQIPTNSGDGMVSVILTINEQDVHLEIRGNKRSYARNRQVGEPLMITYNRTFKRENTDAYTVALPIGKKIIISSVDILDCLFDLLFDAKGFTMILKEEVFNGVVVKNTRTNTDGWFSEVIFKTHTKTRSFVVPCNPYVKMINNA